jgi:16S rRNA A1518/A1519 N6-dimethyltransferase RsmA/KsgA/DIM1 with predicted DNA glycosylase/AP lyase activity
MKGIQEIMAKSKVYISIKEKNFVLNPKSCSAVIRLIRMEDAPVESEYLRKKL